MGYNEELLSKIQSELNIIASSFLDNEIVFDGEVAFYDHDWIKKQYNKDITPFALTLESSDTKVEGMPETTNQYAIGFLCKDKYRDQYDAIFNSLYTTLTDYSFVDDYGVSYTIRPTDTMSSVAFTEGSGKAEKMFEHIIRIEVLILDGLLTGKDISIELDSGPIAFRSFKILHGISSYAGGVSNDYSDNFNYHNNKTTIVIEMIVLDTNLGLLKVNNKVNRSNNEMYIKSGSTTLIDESVRYDGYEMAGEYNSVLTAYIYFTVIPGYSNPHNFTIDSLSFPIIDYSIGMKNITKSLTIVNSNITKDVYLGKARAYVFNVLKTDLGTLEPLYNKILDSLMGTGGTINNEYLTLGINFGRTAYTRQVVISEISDDSSNKGIWKITMLEGEYL